MVWHLTGISARDESFDITTTMHYRKHPSDLGGMTLRLIVGVSLDPSFYYYSLKEVIATTLKT